jgi:hypothetical protein
MLQTSNRKILILKASNVKNEAKSNSELTDPPAEKPISAAVTDTFFKFRG